MGKDKKGKINRIALQGAAVETVERFGSAVKEHIVSLTGNDRERGTTAKRSLKSVSKSKVSEEFKDSNLKQQAGFSAEIKASARETAEHIIAGDKKRTVRTDDLTKQTDAKGREVGGTNDQLFDLAEIDKDGVFIEGSARQVKFVGGSPKSCVEKLLGQKFAKYRENDVDIEIPSDFYDDAIQELSKREADLKKQIASAEQRGDLDLANKHRARLQEVQKTKVHIRKSSVSNAEAMEARLHPELSVTKDIMRTANRAGLEQAKIGALCAGSIAIVKNVVACMKEEKSPTDAAKDVLITTAEGTAFSYATAFSGAVIKGVMQNSASEQVRNLSHSGLPAILVSSAIDVAKIVKAYTAGELSGEQCIESLIQQGVGHIGSAMSSVIAVSAVQGSQVAVVKIAAGMAGSTLGFMAATAVYEEIAQSLKDYELAKEDRIRIEAACEESIMLIRQYREEMIAATEKYLRDHLEVFADGFRSMDKAILNADSNGLIAANTRIQECLGWEIQFRNQAEFDSLMDSEDDFKL